MTGPLAMGAAGALFGLGLVLVVLWFRGVQVRRPRLHRRRLAAVLAGRAGVAATIALLVLLMTGWPVAALLSIVVGVLLPDFVGRDPIHVEIARLRAVADWSQAVADLIGTGAGVSAAVAATTSEGRDAIRGPLRRLGRMEGGLGSALRRFADDLDDGRCDVVVDQLLLGAAGQSGGVGESLRHLAAELRADADALDRVREDRAQPRGEARGVAFAALAFLSLLVAFSPEFVAPLSTPQGQAVLAVCGSAFLVGMWRLARMARRERPARFRPPLPAEVRGW